MGFLLAISDKRLVEIVLKEQSTTGHRSSGIVMLFMMSNLGGGA